jgi:hypothetical protein
LACSTQKKKSEAEEEKPRERPSPRVPARPFFFTCACDPHSTPYARETASTSRAQSAISILGSRRSSLPGQLPTNPPEMDSELLSYKGTACFRLFAPKTLHHCIYPNLSQLPGVSSTRRTREITWRIGAVVARSAFPFLARPKANCRGNLTLHDFASFILLLSIEMHYSTSRCNDALAPTYRPSKPLFTIDSMRTVLTF